MPRQRFLVCRSSLLLVCVSAALFLPVLRPCHGMAEDGTLALAPTAEWAQPLSDAELAGVRGGFSGLSFSVAFTGFFDRLGNAQGNLSVDPGGANQVSPPDVSISDGQVSFVTSIGDFQGTTGIFQIAQVPGSFNIVHNNLFVQINLITSGSSPPSLSSLLR